MLNDKTRTENEITASFKNQLEMEAREKGLRILARIIVRLRTSRGGEGDLVMMTSSKQNEERGD